MSIRPQHYQNGSIEPIDYILSNNLGFCEGNVIKYVSRWKYKNGIEDLKKAMTYLEFLINQVEDQKKSNQNKLFDSQDLLPDDVWEELISGNDLGYQLLTEDENNLQQREY